MEPIINTHNVNAPIGANDVLDKNITDPVMGAALPPSNIHAQDNRNVITHIQNQIAEITLNNTTKRNALSIDMMNKLHDAITMAVNADVKGILLSANGTAFCAGHDFHELADATETKLKELFRCSADLMLMIREVGVPVLAKVHGPAIGAGCQLALTCDLVVASTSASFQTPGGGKGWFCFTPMVALSRVIPAKLAFEMLFTGDPIGAEQALTWGMINRVVPFEQLDSCAEELLVAAVRGSTRNKLLGKHAFYQQLGLSEQQAYVQAVDLMALTGCGDDAQARIRNFIGRTKPSPTDVQK